MDREGMARGRVSEASRHSFRAQFSDKDSAVLDEACRLFGVGKSELVRRLVRASVEVGPALSAECVERIEELTGQVRMIGRNLMQVLKAIHRGDAVGIAESEPVWRGLQELIAALDGELSAWSEAAGVQSADLRRHAGLAARAVGVGQYGDEVDAVMDGVAVASTVPAAFADGHSAE